MFSVFKDGDTIIPVQLEVKDLVGKGGRLYMTVTLTKIKEADVVEEGLNNQQPNLLSASGYSLHDIVKKINTFDEDSLKYIPDQMLSNEQKIAKQSEITTEKNRIAS